MNIISLEDFKKMTEYKTFIQENPDIGYLKVQAFTAYGAVPISEAEILITKDFGNYRVIFFQGYTDSSGIISNIELPAPLTDTQPDVIPSYTIYSLTAIHEGYASIKKYEIAMFGNIKIIQYVKMTPQVELEGVEQNGN